MNVMELKQKFAEIYGGDAKSVRVFYAPGRVNLIGEHIDYNGGYVLPAALTMGIYCAIRVNGGDTIRIAVTDLPGMWETPLNNLEAGKAHSFGNYQIGVADACKKRGYALFGCDLLYHSTMPIGGSGLSSSAAYEVATALALITFSNESTGSDKIDLTEIALISQQAENEFVGMNCGIMDQFASAHGEANKAIYLNCGTLDYKMVPMTLGDCELIIMHTNVKHKLSGSKYNERRSECDSALATLKAKYPDKTHLCDFTLDELNSVTFKNETIKNRAIHAICENERVKSAVSAMTNGDLAEFGKLLNASHESLRTLYEVTGKELDALSAAARETEGCLGARMTGGGFGGCAVALVKQSHADSFIEKVDAAYTKAVGHGAIFYRSGVGDGVHEKVDS